MKGFIAGLFGCVAEDLVLGAFWPTLEILGVPEALVGLVAVAPWIGLVLAAVNES